MIGRVHKAMAAGGAAVLAAAGAAAWYWIVTRPERLAGSDDPERRLQAVRLLTGDDDGDAQSLLAKLTKDPELRVAAAAVRALGTNGGESARGVLADLLAHDDRRTIRAVALAQLGRYETTPLEELTRALAEDRDPGMRAAAAEALAHRGDRAALPALVAALDDGDMGVRVRAIEAVSSITGRRPEYDPGPNVSPAERRATIERIQAEVLPGP